MIEVIKEIKTYVRIFLIPLLNMINSVDSLYNRKYEKIES